jgi:hypothetical protein
MSSSSDAARRARLGALIDGYVSPYLARNPSTRAAVDALAGVSDAVHWDHLAFRSFDVCGGVDALARVFLDHGYVPRDELRFEDKRLVARWYAPPDEPWAREPDGDPSFPRVFVSNVEVDRVSPEVAARARSVAAQATPESIRRAARDGGVPWSTPVRLDTYRAMERESEYAAWTLVNGYALNHVAVSVHRLRTRTQTGTGGTKATTTTTTTLERVNDLLTSPPIGLRLSAAGGNAVKASPDGLLRQSSTVADDAAIEFVDAEGRLVRAIVPASYVEFAERLPLPTTVEDDAEENRHTAAEVKAEDDASVVPERRRRDGFEVGNADKIFESTFAAQRRRTSG